LEITFTAGDASGAVTYAVTDADGISVASGSATNETEPGRYTFVFAPQTAVKTLTIAWTGTWGGVAQTISTYAEVVGNHLFTLAEARAFDKAVLASTTTYPDAAIREARAGITDFFQQVTGVSFIPRYGRAVLDDPRSTDLWLPVLQLRTLLAGSLAGTALTAGEIADIEVYEYGKLWRTAGWPGSTRRDVIVSYEHGYQTVPWDIHQAALTYLRYILVSSDISDRTISWSSELGTFRQAVAGRNYPTGLPSVDAALGRYTAAAVLA
jgi:hypothetical protein